jgi:DNA-binding transcriptional LysR family regulator
MQRNALPELNAFLSVAEHLSFRAAAARLGLTSPAVSHAMRQLEERLGVRLLNRTTRSVSLTDAGLQLVHRLRPAINQISGALAELNERREHPTGHLRIRVSPMAATVVVMPMWRRFLSTYPEVHLELQVAYDASDIVASGLDAGIGPKDWVPADMIAVRVSGPQKLIVVAAPCYLAGRRQPRTPEELISHSCVQYRFGPDEAVVKWSFERNGKIKRIGVAGGLIVNSAELAIRAAVDGLGLVHTSEAIAAPYLQTGQLVTVLEGWSPTLQGLYLFYHGHRQVPAALRAFIDMIHVRRSLRQQDAPSRTFSPDRNEARASAVSLETLDSGV